MFLFIWLFYLLQGLPWYEKSCQFSLILCWNSEEERSQKGSGWWSVQCVFPKWQMMVQNCVEHRRDEWNNESDILINVTFPMQYFPVYPVSAVEVGEEVISINWHLYIIWFQNSWCQSWCSDCGIEMTTVTHLTWWSNAVLSSVDLPLRLKGFEVFIVCL